MEKEFVSYKEAQALKKLGFDEKCFGYWSDWGDQEPFLISSEYGQEKESCQIRRKNFLCSAPLYQQAFRWIREKFGLYGQISQIEDTEGISNSCTFTIISMPKERYIYTHEDSVLNDPNEAEFEMIKKLIEFAKK